MCERRTSTIFKKEVETGTSDGAPAMSPVNVETRPEVCARCHC